MLGSVFVIGEIFMKTAIITGGTSGIGLATAKIFFSVDNQSAAYLLITSKYFTEEKFFANIASRKS